MDARLDARLPLRCLLSLEAEAETPKSWALIAVCLNFPKMYLSLINFSTALLSSSPSKGNGWSFGFQTLLFLLLPPPLLTQSKSLSFQRSRVNDLTSEWASSSLLPKTFLCTEAHLPHKKTPKFTEHHVGYGAPHSPQRLPFSGRFTRSFSSFSTAFDPLKRMPFFLCLFRLCVVYMPSC